MDLSGGFAVAPAGVARRGTKGLHADLQKTLQGNWKQLPEAVRRQCGAMGIPAEQPQTLASLPGKLETATLAKSEPTIATKLEAAGGEKGGAASQGGYCQSQCTALLQVAKISS